MRSSGKYWMGGTVLGLAAAGGLAYLYATSVARQQVLLDRYTIHAANPGLPPSGLTILHLTDFHMRSDGRVQARKLAQLQRLLAGAQYDIVALTGDLIHDEGGLPLALSLVRALTPRYGVYFVPGNHDYAEYTRWGLPQRSLQQSLSERIGYLREFVGKVVRNEMVRLPICFHDVAAMIAQLEAIGVRPLVNTSTRLALDGGEVWLAGVDDEMESRPDLAAAFEGIPPRVPLVLLAHNPDIWLQCGSDRADLVLSGHTHGGQIQLPLMGAIHTQGTHLPRRAAAGWFERDRSKMFVGRGLGESIPLRFGARPQVALITILPK